MSINKNSQKTPNLRFKGFTDDWEQRKLGELVSIKGRIGFRGYTREDIVSKDDGVLTFSPGNIDNNQIKISDNNTYITRNKYMESPEIMIENNDILFVKTGSTLGKSAIIRNFKEEATINPQIVLFKEISINQEYLSNYLVSKYIQKQISSVRIGGAIPTLTETAIGNLIIWVPSSKEQDVIGRFFRNLDDTITLQQRKLDQLNQLKEALLQQMFPGKGETVPKLRFAGFEGDWEERKLGKIIKTHSIKPYIVEPTDKGNYPIIQQGDNSIYGYADGEPFYSYQGVTLFGDHTVSIYKPSEPFFIATDALKILSADDIDGYFLYVLLMKYKPQSQGYKRHFTILKQENVWITENRDEQQKIGKLFKNLESNISFYQQKLKQLQNMKQVLLQNMFI